MNLANDAVFLVKDIDRRPFFWIVGHSLARPADERPSIRPYNYGTRQKRATSSFWRRIELYVFYVLGRLRLQRICWMKINYSNTRCSCEPFVFVSREGAGKRKRTSFEPTKLDTLDENPQSAQMTSTFSH